MFLLQPADGGAGGEGGEAGEGAEPEEEVIYKYIPPTPKDWVSLGSEKEIAEESLVEHRVKVTETTYTDSSNSTQKYCCYLYCCYIGYSSVIITFSLVFY